MSTGSQKKSLWKKLILAAILLLAIGAAFTWYIFTVKFEDTAGAKADYKVNALDLIGEFKKDDPAANKKYTEKILEVTGRITAVEKADSTVNLKIADADGSYIIFAFQQQDMAEAKKVKEGDSVAIKGSCSGGTYSEILETEYISLKRCSINK